MKVFGKKVIRWRATGHKDGTSTEEVKLDDGSRFVRRVTDDGVVIREWMKPEVRRSIAPTIHTDVYGGSREKVKRQPGLARFPGDPFADCRSSVECDQKIAMRGMEKVNIADEYYAEHPAQMED